MEFPAYPPNLSLKEEQENEIQIQELEDAPIDMQKVQICSEGAWVSKSVGSSLRATLALGLLLGQTWEVKNSPSLICLHS